MDFRHQMNDHFNQFPDHIRTNQTVRALSETITLSYENLFRVIGPVAIRADINWNHIVEMLRGSVDIDPENIQNYIDRFRLDSDFILPENDRVINIEQPFENENNDISSLISEIEGYVAAESDSDAESDPDAESDSDSESDSDQDDSLHNGTDENLWGCAHCGIFIGNYDDVCAHENECLLNHSRNEP